MMDGADHEHGADVESTVIRPRHDTVGSDAAEDPEGLIADTRPGHERRPAADDAGVDDRPHSAHAQTAAPDAAPRSLPWYRFSVNGGEALTTDVPTLIGRSPRARRLPGPQAPRLLRVDSANQEVSGTHVEVRQEGAAVVVTDLRSTNGTTVTMPGADPVRLLPGESVVAVPGSLIDIGDGNVAEVLGIERPVSSDVRGRLTP